MAKNYNTRTASLKATIADIRNLDAKQINLDGKNILEYISDSEFNSYDTRDPQLKNDELDIWNTAISLSDNGHIEVKPKEHGIKSGDGYIYEGITESQEYILKTAVKVIDGEVLGDDDTHLMYWQTNGLTSGIGLLRGGEFTTFNSDLSNLTDGYDMFRFCSNLTLFNSDLSNLTTGEEMFADCTYLTSFNVDLPSLTDGTRMFSRCISLSTFNPDLSSLTTGEEMFYDCNMLESFNVDLPSLTDSTRMFNYSGIYTFNSNLQNLMNGGDMFSETPLKSFSSNLSSLDYGGGMFRSCSSLTSFDSDLPSLADGENMFFECKLDAPSVANIVHTLPTHETGGTIDIGIGCDDTEADQLLFAQECDCDTWQELLDDFSTKNWTVSFQCNSRPTAATYGMRRGATLPIYAKLIEVIMPTDENERKPHYAYISQDGSKFYNINYFHSTNGSTEGYDVFSSLEEAISTYNVTPKN